MFEIAICDDDKEFLAAFEKQLTAAIQGAGMSGRIDCYTDCGALLEDVRGGRKYDLLFLDILFGTEDRTGPDGNQRESGGSGAEPRRETGMDAAETVREMGMSMARALRETGDGADIIFMSSTPDFAVDSFDVSPLHYLLKPIGAGKLKMALARFLDRNRPGNRGYRKKVLSSFAGTA